MRAQNPAVTEPGFIALCVELARATFAKDRPGSSGAKVSAKRRNVFAEPRRFLAAVENWFYRRRLKERDAYLAQSADIFDLERRIRDLERRPHN